MNSIYYQLQEVAKNSYDEEIIKKFNEFANIDDQIELERLALQTQIVVKKSPPNYNHGFLIFAALASIVEKRKEVNQFSIMDIGTARGFSALVCAMVLRKYSVPGTILSIDTIPHSEVRRWNCILDGENGISRKEIVRRFDYSKNIVFLSGKSKNVFNNLHLDRINFAFVDGDHKWRSLKHEIDFIVERQMKNDVLLFDDYTPEYYPDVVRAVSTLASKYHIQTFGNSHRGYALLTKI